MIVGYTDDDHADTPVVIAVTRDASDRALLALQTSTEAALLLFPDHATAARAVGANANRAAPGAADAPGIGRLLPQPADGEDRGLRIDELRAQVTWNGRPLPLTRLERQVLGCLAEPPERVWPYGSLYQAAWGESWLGDSSTLHAVVKRLRRKLRVAGVTATVESVRGVGFRLAG
jgi:DNA-binding response OmpR family regulator